MKISEMDASFSLSSCVLQPQADVRGAVTDAEGENATAEVIHSVQCGLRPEKWKPAVGKVGEGRIHRTTDRAEREGHISFKGFKLTTVWK